MIAAWPMSFAGLTHTAYPSKDLFLSLFRWIHLFDVYACMRLFKGALRIHETELMAPW